MKIFRLIHSIVREKLKIFSRSSRWPEVRDVFIKTHAECSACGGKRHLQVHHIRPFHLDPKDELDSENLITLCMGRDECHLEIGHGGNFANYNPHVVASAKEYRTNPKARERVKFEARVKSLQLKGI